MRRRPDGQGGRRGARAIIRWMDQAREAAIRTRRAVRGVRRASPVRTAPRRTGVPPDPARSRRFLTGSRRGRRARRPGTASARRGRGVARASGRPRDNAGRRRRARRQGRAPRAGGGQPLHPIYQLEERFARDFRRKARDWEIVREPEPVVAGNALLFPDFVLRHRGNGGRRWLLRATASRRPAPGHVVD